MIKGNINKNLIVVLFICCSNIVSGQIQTKIDTILCNNNHLIIEYPAISRIKDFHYEEGTFKTISCPLDTAFITIHVGKMVNLPLTDLCDKIVCSEFVLGKDIRCFRGYSLIANRKRYFREDNYIRYGINIVYENVGEERLDCYEQFFNNIKIQIEE